MNIYEDFMRKSFGNNERKPVLILLKNCTSQPFNNYPLSEMVKWFEVYNKNDFKNDIFLKVKDSLDIYKQFLRTLRWKDDDYDEVEPLIKALSQYGESNQHISKNTISLILEEAEENNWENLLLIYFVHSDAVIEEIKTTFAKDFKIVTVGIRSKLNDKNIKKIRMEEKVDFIFANLHEGNPNGNRLSFHLDYFAMGILRYMANDTIEVEEGAIYKHFKGNEYMVLGVAEHTETEEQMVIYQSLGNVGKAEKGKIYVRPYGMFVSKVDKKEYPDADQRYRFVKVR